MNFLLNSQFLAVVISLIAYMIGLYLKQKIKLAILNPLLIACVIVILYLLSTRADYKIYQKNMDFINYLLTPSTVCLAIPLYHQVEVLKKHFFAIIIGSLSGVLSTFLLIFLFATLFKLSHTHYVTLLPKSVTTAVGMVLSQEIQGIVPVTIAAIVITGIFGNIIAPSLCKIFKIYDPIAKGVGIGCASHVIGTTKAIEMGELEGAMSTLSTVISAILTSVFISFVTNLY